MAENKVNSKALFQRATQLDADVLTAREAVETAIAKRGEAVKAIQEALGSGPFDYKGDILTIRGRDQKVRDEEGEVVMVEKDGKMVPKIAGKTWFFVSQGDKKLQKIE